MFYCVLQCHPDWLWFIHVLTQKWCTAPLIPSCVCSKWMCTLHSWVKTHKFMPFAKLASWESELFTLIMKLSLPWWLFYQIIFWSSVWKIVNCWANTSFKSSQFTRTCIWCQTMATKEEMLPMALPIWGCLSIDSLVALDFCNYPLAVWDMIALDLCLNDVPAVSLWVIPRTAFLCVCLLSSPLWNSFTLTSGVRWNEPGKVSVSCPFCNLFEQFCVCRSCLWQCIACRGGSLFSSCSVCLSHCVHTSCILLF